MSAQPVYVLIYATDTEALRIDSTGVYDPQLTILLCTDESSDLRCAGCKHRESAHDYAMLASNTLSTRCERSGCLCEAFQAPAVFACYRFDLPMCTLIDGVLSDNPYHPELAAWFADSLASVARSADWSLNDLESALCSQEPARRARAYADIAHYHGLENFDSYPIMLTEAEATKALE